MAQRISPKRDRTENSELIIEENDDDINIVSSSPIVSMRSRSPIRQKRESSNKASKDIQSPQYKKDGKITVKLDDLNYIARAPSIKKTEEKENETNKEKVERLTDNPDPDYENIDDELKEMIKEKFKYKYRNLLNKYNNIKLEYNEDDPLLIMHENYHNVIRDIYATQNSGFYEILYIVFLCIVEFIFVNKLGISSFKDYAKYERNRIKKTRVLIVEYIASQYSYGWGEPGTSEHVFWRFVKMYAFSLVLFLFTHTVVKYLGFADNVKEDLANQLEKKYLTPVTKDAIENGNIGERDGDDSKLTNILIDAAVGGVSKLAGSFGKAAAPSAGPTFKF